MDSQESIRVQPAPDYLHTVVGAWSRRARGRAPPAGRSAATPSNREFYRLLTSDPGDLQLVLSHVEALMGFPIAYVLGVRVADVVHHIDTGFDPSSPTTPRGSPLWTPSDGPLNRGLATVDLGIDADYKARFTRDVQRAEGLEITQGGAVGSNVCAHRDRRLRAAVRQSPRCRSRHPQPAASTRRRRNPPLPRSETRTPHGPAPLVPSNLSKDPSRRLAEARWNGWTRSVLEDSSTTVSTPRPRRLAALLALPLLTMIAGRRLLAS